MSTTENIQDKATGVLLQMVDVTVKTMSDVVEFGKQQIPEVIHQLLMWNIMKASIWVVLSAVFAIGLVMLVNRYKPALEKVEAGLGICIQICGWLIALLVGGGVFINNLLEAVYIWIAPKVWLIEYAAELVKKA